MTEPTGRPTAEPVAWRVDGVRNGKPRVWFFQYDPPQKEYGPDDKVTPLYASAPRTVPAQRAGGAGWRTDIENAPRDGTEILARWHTDIYDVIDWTAGTWMDGESKVGEPTHWQLIDPPNVAVEDVRGIPTSPPSGAPGVRYAPAEPLERFVHGPDFTLNKVYPVVEHGNGWLRVIALASTEERQAQIIAALSVSPHERQSNGEPSRCKNTVAPGETMEPDTSTGDAPVVSGSALSQEAATPQESLNIEDVLLNLRGVSSALDDALGDSDVTHMDDDELRDRHPVQWAMQRLNEVMWWLGHFKEATPPQSQEENATLDEIRGSYLHGRAEAIQECANLALAIDGGRGKEIAEAIRALDLRAKR